MNEMILGYDVEGDDLLGAEDLLGAIRRRRRRAAAGRPVYSQPPLSATGISPNAKIRSYMGFGSLSWTGAADSADKTSVIEPQETFRGERLVISQVVTGGADAGLTQLRQITVGTQPQSPSVEQPAPVSMFSPDATYSGLDLQVAQRGTKIQITLARTASPGAGVTVTAAMGMYGEWIR